MLDRRSLDCDLCVVGGGLAGICTAVSAAREGVRVILMHERPMLGGNASSEIRMWISGAHGINNRETGIIEEIALENLYRNPTKSYAVWDSILYDFVHREKNITLLLNTTCLDAETEEGVFPHGRTIRIRRITGYQMTTQRYIDVSAVFFADCSGDSILAPLCGAAFRFGREAASEFGEDSSALVPDRKTMGMSCLIQGRETTEEVPYLPPSFSAHLTEKDFEDREPEIYNDDENYWYLELGGNKDSIADTEEVRDELLSLACGTWDYIKNSGNFRSENWDLDFLGFLPGKRESRRMCGEYMITQRDISDGRVFPDEIAFGGWPLDDHFPDGFYHRGVPNTDIRTPAPYSIPYRALYSANVDNLFFAGRNISMTHMAMSSIRVMATCALLGQAVGCAAALSVKHDCRPHDVYLSHMEELQMLLLWGDSFLPSMRRPVSPLCTEAVLTGADDRIRNGEDRPHHLYGTTDETAILHIPSGSAVTYRFPKCFVHYVHLVFDSDLDRLTLHGSTTERTQPTRSNRRLDMVKQHMPTTLCRAFRLIGRCGNTEIELLTATDNHLRCRHITIDAELDGLVLIPQSTWGDPDARLISFDFG